MLQFVTDFADLAVTLPVVVFVFFALLWQNAAQQAVMLMLAVAFTLGVVVVLKLTTFLIWPFDSNADLQSPSGHTAGAIIVYGGLIQLLGPPRWRVAGFVAVAALVAFTRVALGQHTLADVVIGAADGGCGLALLGWLLARPNILPNRTPRVAATLGAAGFAMVVMHGHHLGGEDTLRDLAAWLLLPTAPIIG